MNLHLFDFPVTCDLKYPWTLPFLKCRVCKKPAMGWGCSYASIELSAVRSELQRLSNGDTANAGHDIRDFRELLSPHVPEFVHITSQTSFGRPTGRILFNYRHILFGSRSILVTPVGLKALREAEVQGFTATSVSLAHGRRPPVQLYDLEFPATLREPPSFYASPDCEECGYRERVTKSNAAVHRPTIPKGADLMTFRDSKVSFIVASDRFKQVAESLAGPKQARFSPMPVMDK